MPRKDSIALYAKAEGNDNANQILTTTIESSNNEMGWKLKDHSSHVDFYDLLIFNPSRLLWMLSVLDSS